MDEPRNNAAVERRLKEALKRDRARVQVGKMSGFGLMEMSRQRLHSSFLESSYHVCPHCGGKGLIRSTESSAMHALHLLDEAAAKNQNTTLVMSVPPEIASYVLNMKRETLRDIESRFGVQVQILADAGLIKSSDYRMERIRSNGDKAPVHMDPPSFRRVDKNSERAQSIDAIVQAAAAEEAENGGEGRHRRHGRNRRRDWRRKQKQLAENQATMNEQHEEEKSAPENTEPNFTIVEQASLNEVADDHKKGKYRNHRRRSDKKGDQNLPVIHEDKVPAERTEHMPAPVEKKETPKAKKGGWWNRLIGE